MTTDTDTDTVYQRAVVHELDQIDTAGDGRTITVRLVPWDTPQTVYDAGRTSPYVEQFARGGLIPPPTDDPIPVYVEREHNGPVVGLITGYDDRPDGLYATVRVSRSSNGLDTLADLDERILRYVSVDFYDRPVPRTTTAVTRTAARLRRVAFTLNPQHDAPVVAVRSNPEPNPDPTEQDPEMTDTATAPDATAPDATAPDAVTVTRSAPADDRAPVARPGGLTLHTPTPSRFATFGHFVRAAAVGEVDPAELARFQRALADVVTGDVSGLIREQWISEVIDIARTYTPTVNNWRRRPLPDKGMTMHQPIVGTRPTVDEQVTQKTEIASTDVTILEVSWPIKTYAGGNDVSLQAIERTEPGFLDELMRLYVREMALDLNTTAATTLHTAAAFATSGNTGLEYTTAEAFDELVIDASAAFMTALLRPAELMAISVDLWSALGKAKDLDERPLYPDINPMNAGGTFDAQSTTGQVRRISWYVEPALGAGIKGVIGVADAFLTALGPMRTLSVDVPSKIGRDVAVWQEAAMGAADPSGLVQIVNVTP